MTDSSLPAGLPHPTHWDLSGDIAKMALLSILQFLEMGKATGILRTESPDAPPGLCELREGRISSCALGHLHGREAVLAMLGQKTGLFAFASRDLSANHERAIAVGPMIMEAVRLEDELERVQGAHPGPDAALVLRDPHEIPLDPLECGGATVMATIAARPGTSAPTLERQLPLSPLQIALSVAWLASSGRLLSNQAVSCIRRLQPETDDCRAKLLARYPRGLRVVYGLPPAHDSHELIASITEIARTFDAGPAWMSLAPDGAAMARVRPRAGGLLSIACIAATRSRSELFRSLAATADLLFVTDRAEEGVLESWRGLAPKHAPFSLLACNRANSCLLEGLRQHALSLEAGDDQVCPWGEHTHCTGCSRGH